MSCMSQQGISMANPNQNLCHTNWLDSNQGEDYNAMQGKSVQ